MTLKKPLLALVLSFIVAFSFLAFVEADKNASADFSLNQIHSCPRVTLLNPSTFPALSTCTAQFSSHPSLEDSAYEAQNALASNSTRAEIYDFIVANPGVQFRGICAGLGIAVGTAEFHLGVLKKAGLISFIRDGKFKRFFAAKKFTQTQMNLLVALRHETSRAIITKIAAAKTAGHCELASWLGISSQGLTWQMSRLRQRGIIQESYNGLRVTYRLNDAYQTILPQLLSCLGTRVTSSYR